MDDLITALKKAQGRLATGHFDRCTFETVRVTCRACGGVTVFALHPGQPRPTPAPCPHCGVDI